MESTRTTKKTQLSNKFGCLYTRQKQTFHKSEWVENLSDKQLTDNEERLLRKGLNYATHHTQKDVLTFIDNVDRTIDETTTEIH